MSGTVYNIAAVYQNGSIHFTKSVKSATKFIKQIQLIVA